jgi:4-diphosphocytidyl-2-C-methyl-D-erythritol kinase
MATDPDRSVGPVTVRVPGKVNLHLGVGAVGEDGYHPVVTVLQAVSVFDEVTAEPAGGLSVAVRGEGGSGTAEKSVGELVPLGAENLAARAASLLAEHCGLVADVALRLAKDIPVAAGMAGGSADAAAALVACDALWDTRLPRAELVALAARLGSDVPFALTGGTALGVGRGEQLTPVLAKGSYDWVFVLADGGLSTPAVYREYDRVLAELPERVELLQPAVAQPDELLAALRAGDAAALGAALGNDLQLPALRLRPALRETLEAGRAAGAVGALVSGSGPTCAFLASSPAHAAALAQMLTDAAVGRAVRVASGPVPGATVVAG